MADKKNDTAAEEPQVEPETRQVVGPEPSASVPNAPSDTAAPPDDRPRLDETVEGGQYVVNGIPMNAHGEPL